MFEDEPFDDVDGGEGLRDVCDDGGGERREEEEGEGEVYGAQSSANEESLHSSDLSFGALEISAEGLGLCEALDIAVEL